MPIESGAVASAAATYLNAWKNEDYSTMYNLLTALSRDAVTEDEFRKHYFGVAGEAALAGIDYDLFSALVNEDTAQVGYKIVLHSILVGDITRNSTMKLSLESGQWKVQWADTLVLPELAGGNYLSMLREGYSPSRANIYDRYGQALVAQTDSTALGLIPDFIDPLQEDDLFRTLTELTGLSKDQIRAMYTNFPKGADWYLPLGELPNEKEFDRQKLSNFSGLVLRPYKSRFYFEGGIAPHVLGFVSSIPPEESEEYRLMGYRRDDRVGRSGLEKWGEAYLAGKHGGALYVLDDQNVPVTRLAEVAAQPSQAIYTTLEKDLQLASQAAIGEFRGAIVIIERDSGRILTLVSSPGFDPNVFEPININGGAALTEVLSQPDQPMLNRAAQGQYPLGSVFKVITMAAALESDFYSKDSTYQCGYFFDEIQGTRLNDWTYEYYQQDGRTIPSGLLTLPQGLIRSCNPFFWHIGLDFFNRGRTQEISNMARAFGLGSPTGVVGMDESAGQITDPESQIDSTNYAIGQGSVLVTPLQVASFMAAIGNGGTLYQPQIIESISPPDKETEVTFKPVITRKLPLGEDNLRIIQEALVGVVRGQDPQGTAWHSFTGLDFAVAGKTGTAQSGGDEPHAWFAGYTFEEREDRPDIAIAVVLENAGEGSVYAAPVFRRVVELYFSGQPQRLYPWETEYNVTSESGGENIPLQTSGATSTPAP